MAMLAEPKRKQKFGNDPRNTFWSNDESKFGFRMLESMGWKKGKGLGAKESGMTEHIRSVQRGRDDVRGVGCSKSHADKWIAHQDDFNSLLSSLNDSPNDSPAEDQKTDLSETSKTSLEKKSKLSKSRVHYHKFTKSKDLSSRSSHELDCIFGKRKGQPSESSTPTTQSEANSDNEDEVRPSFNLASDTSTTNNNNNNNNNNIIKNSDTDMNQHGIKTITSSSSVQEYFAMKMAELKRARERVTADSSLSGNDDHELTAVSSSSSQGQGEQMLEIHDEKDGDVSDHTEDVQLRKSSKKKKKKKLRDRADDSQCETDPNESDVSKLVEEQQSASDRKTAKKSKKQKTEEISQLESVQPSEISTESSVNLDEEDSCHKSEKKKKKKKKKKNKDTESEEDGLNTSILRHENDGKERPSKRVSFYGGGDEVRMIPGRGKDVAEDGEEKVQEESAPETEKLPKKTKKKTKKNEDEAIEPAKNFTDDKEQQQEEVVPVKKKSKKRKKEEKEQGQETSVKKMATKSAKDCTDDTEHQQEEVTSAEGKSSGSKKRKREEKEQEDETPEKKRSKTKESAVKFSSVTAEPETEKDTFSTLNTNKKGQFSSASPVSRSADKKSPKQKKKSGGSHVNQERICQRFEGAILNCIKGYGAKP